MPDARTTRQASPCLGHDPLATKRLVTASRTQWRLIGGELYTIPGPAGPACALASLVVVRHSQDRFTKSFPRRGGYGGVLGSATRTSFQTPPARGVWGFSELAMQAIRFTKIRGNPFIQGLSPGPSAGAGILKLGSSQTWLSAIARSHDQFPEVSRAFTPPQPLRPPSLLPSPCTKRPESRCMYRGVAASDHATQ